MRANKIHSQQKIPPFDLLPPMLFILVMDVLNLLIARVVEANLLQPLSSRDPSNTGCPFM
jgi:hypothetical protein